MSTYKVKEQDSGKRADIFVTSKYPGFTRSSLSALFDNDLVKINQKTARASYKLKPGDKILVDETLLNTEPPDIVLPIMYEDNDVVVIDKPAGILTHAKGALNTEATVASFIKPKLNDESSAGNRAGIVHRLDRATSGVIIIARNDQTLKFLQKQFSTRQVRKTYLAIAEGVPKEAEAVIDAPIGRNPKAPQTFKVLGSGKPAQTHYKILKTFSKKNKSYSILELKPVTGRTHQLRVHMTYIGHPIVGDPVYGKGDGNLMLHATSLELNLPSGQKKVFKAPTPKIFQDFFS